MFCKLRRNFGLFCSVPEIVWVGVGLMQIITQYTCPVSQAKRKLQMTLKYSRLLSREGARHCFIHASGVDIHKLIRKTKKNLQNQMSQLLLETGRTQERNLGIQKETKTIYGLKPTNHKPRPFWTRSNICFLTERSAKMIDGTEKPKVP